MALRSSGVKATAKSAHCERTSSRNSSNIAGSPDGCHSPNVVSLFGRIDALSAELVRRYRDGEARHEAGLQDYAFLVAGLLDLYEATFETRWLERALELTERQIELFRDPDGGFFDTPGTDETLLTRTKEDYDGAEPTGNAVSAMNLLRLGTMLDRDDLSGLGAGCVRSFGARLNTMPDATVQMLCALLRLEATPMEIVLVGTVDSAETSAMRAVVTERYLPHATILQVDDGTSRDFFQGRNSFIGSLPAAGAHTTAYVCEQYACQAPVAYPSALRELLAGRTHPSRTTTP